VRNVKEPAAVPFGLDDVRDGRQHTIIGCEANPITVRNLEPFYCPAKKTGKQIVATRLERCGA